MIKRLTLCIIVVLVSISILFSNDLKLGKGEVLLEPSSKPVIIKTLNGNPSNPFGRQLDTLFYDDGTAYWGYQGTSNALFWAVRFTPAQPCTVKAGLFMVWVYTGTAPVCTSFVWDDAGGTPGSMVEGPIIKQTTGYPNWDRVDFTGGYIDGDDFWFGYWLPWYDPDTTFALTDASSEYGTRMAIGVRQGGGWNWNVNPGLAGDLMIRAIVAYGAGVEEEETQETKSIYNVKTLPNPMTTKTRITYSVPEQTYVKINIYNIAGGFIRTLVDSKVNIGTYSVIWDRKDAYGIKVPQGVYIYNFITPAYKSMGKITVIR